MGEDEATEGEIVFVGRDGGFAVRVGAKEFKVGLCQVLRGVTTVFIVTLLPCGTLLGIGEFLLCAFGYLSKRGVQFTLMRCDQFLVPMAGVMRNDRSAIAMRDINIAVAIDFSR